MYEHKKLISADYLFKIYTDDKFKNVATLNMSLYIIFKCIYL